MSRSLPTLVALALLLASAGTARAARSIVDRNYDCKIIASTREFPGRPDWLGPPAMNAWGQVVFEAFATVGVDTIQELRVGRGDLVGGVPTSHVVAKGGENFQGPLAPFASIEEGAIDDSARVTFVGYEPSNGGGPRQGIYRVFTNHPATVLPSPLFGNQEINPTSPYIGFDPLHSLGANAAGSVVFEGITENGTAYFRDDVEVARNYTNGVQIVNPPVLLHAGQPWTAYLASLDSPNSGGGIWVNGVQWASSTASGEGGFTALSLSGNAGPVIAYSRSGLPGITTWELAVTGPFGTSVYVDADEDPFEPSGAPFGSSINVWGEVAFVASPEGDGDTLLVADGGQQIYRVNCQNQQQTFNASFFHLDLSPRAINADGQIAFRGETFEHVFLYVRIRYRVRVQRRRAASECSKARAATTAIRSRSRRVTRTSAAAIRSTTRRAPAPASPTTQPATTAIPLRSRTATTAPASASRSRCPSRPRRRSPSRPHSRSPRSGAASSAREPRARLARSREWR